MLYSVLLLLASVIGILLFLHVFELFLDLLLHEFDKYQTRRIMERKLFIETYDFPGGIIEKVKYHYPHLSDGQLSRVMEGLRTYFIICGRDRHVSMPSQVATVAWQEFILTYRESCLRLEILKPLKVNLFFSRTEDGINYAWELCCKLETIDAKNPIHLPLLFALDAELDIPDGFHDSLDDWARRYYEYIKAKAVESAG